MWMVGENIQRAREQLQSMRGQLGAGQFGMGQFKLSEKLGQFKLSEKLASRPLMKHLSTRMSKGTSAKSSSSSVELSNPGVYVEPTSAPYESFISV